ncbi:hypothetical protein [Rhodanobacter sp. L36]|uniref:hypothetical protein n=1 Tax=Rhodanobacter sp. L36 TaxID=1747221 RepID=UPI00131CA347|nr:hypothetical protein [Rhodanobacter sp. L36]
MSISDRIRRLERTAGAGSESLADEAREALANRLPEQLLRHYLQGDLDAQAERLLGIAAYLKDLETDGYVIQLDGHWIPLFIGDDDEINARVIACIEKLDDQRIFAAIETRSARRENH